MSHRSPVLAALALLAVQTSLLVGCDGVTYLQHLIEGQVSIIGNVESIDDVLASGRLSEEEDRKLRLIVSTREFAVDVIGLDAGDSYTTFYDTAGDPLAFNLSAARRDGLVAYEWVFPIAGAFPYIAFFDESYLNRVEQEMQDAGYDTFSYELDAYSTLGLFSDPVRSTMLQRGDLSLVETIIHELLHNTIWRMGATTFNESLATFVGRQGAVEYLEKTYGTESNWPQMAQQYYADVDAANAYLNGLYDDLAAYYAQPLTKQQKIEGREAVYEAARQKFRNDIQPTLSYPESFEWCGQLPTNNAWLLANYRYNYDLSTIANVHEATGRDWSATLAVFRAAQNAVGDPFDYLREWLATHETSGE